MWMLVFIAINSGVPEATNMGEFDTIYNCFDEREYIWEYELPEDKNRIQLICIRNEDYK